MFSEQSLQRATTVVVRGLPVKLVLTSAMDHYRARTFATKEPETLDWLDQHLRGDDVLWDVGANVGLYSLYAVLRCRTAVVVSIEPASHNVGRLCENLLHNEVTQAEVMACALSDVDGLEWLYLSELSSGSSMHSMGSEECLLAFGATPVMRCAVPTLTLDTLVATGKTPSPTLLKIDVDGSESRVLRGGPRLLASSRLRSVLVEVNWTRELPCTSIVPTMHDAGFVVQTTGEERHCGRMFWKNLIFTKP